MGQFQRTQVGNAELIALQDSWAAIPPGYPFPDVPAEAWDPYKEFFDSEGRLTFNISCWLIRSAGRTILVDTGIGGRKSQMDEVLAEPAALPEVMQAAGVRADEVEIVLFTHLHYDHSGWNTIAEGGKAKPLFPQARHVVQRREWDYWTSSDELRRSAEYEHVLAPIEQAGLLDLVEGEHAVTSEVVTVSTPGHTPGHVSLAIVSGGERAYVIGDAANYPVQLSEPDWRPFSDIDQDLAIKTRKALFQRIESENALIAAGHFPFPGLGHSVREGGRRVFKPLA